MRAFTLLLGCLCHFGVALTSRGALAEHCQMHGLSKQNLATADVAIRPSLSFYGATNWETVRYRNLRYEGHFEGVFAELGLGREPFMVAVRLPYYRLLRNGLPVTGFGDVTLLGQHVLLRPSANLQLGWRAAFSVPTGDSDRDLGMGHAMFMPGAFARGHWSEFVVRLGVEYAGALTSGGGGHHAHRASFPIVQPMNSQELTGILQTELFIVANVSLRAQLQSTRPLVEHGAARSIVGLGITLQRSHFSSFLEWQRAVEGSPFTARIAGGVTLGF